jgi:hypothetical protein
MPVNWSPLPSTSSAYRISSNLSWASAPPACLFFFRSACGQRILRAAGLPVSSTTANTLPKQPSPRRPWQVHIPPPSFSKAMPADGSVPTFHMGVDFGADGAASTGAGGGAGSEGAAAWSSSSCLSTASCFFACRFFACRGRSAESGVAVAACSVLNDRTAYGMLEVAACRRVMRPSLPRELCTIDVGSGDPSPDLLLAFLVFCSGGVRRFLEDDSAAVDEDSALGERARRLRPAGASIAAGFPALFEKKNTVCSSLGLVAVRGHPTIECQSVTLRHPETIFTTYVHVASPIINLTRL